jgi:hypothetical protein
VLKIKEVFEMLNCILGAIPYFFEKEETLGETVAVAIFRISAVLHFSLATDYTSSLVPLDAWH